jgi:hypothetical protein
LRSSPTLMVTFLRYVHVFMMQQSQTALANGRGRLNERLARWLLMWQDRLRTPHITVTHAFLALLLAWGGRPSPWRSMNSKGRGCSGAPAISSGFLTGSA